MKFLISIFAMICAISYAQENPDWFWQNPIPQGNTLSAVQVVDANTIIAAGGGTIMKSTNSGSDWKIIFSEISATTHIEDLFFLDNSTGWASGENGVILKTTDGGDTWSKQDSKTEVTLKAISFIDDNTGWIVGDEGTIVKTTDGGSTWSAEDLGDTLKLEGVHLVSSDEVFITGWTYFSGMTFSTTNGGSSWSKRFSIENRGLYNLLFTNDNTGFAPGEWGMVEKTSNGGSSWTNTSHMSGDDLY